MGGYRFQQRQQSIDKLKTFLKILQSTLGETCLGRKEEQYTSQRFAIKQQCAFCISVWTSPPSALPQFLLDERLWKEIFKYP